MIKITNDLLEEFIKKARLSSRKRHTHNFHQTSDDKLQRMINTMNRNTYVQPHKHEHPDKREIFIILKGEVLVIIFDNRGEVTDSMLLSYQKGCLGVEIPPAKWHTIIPLKDGSVLYEVKDGPYNPANDKVFASWAPAEGEENIGKYIKRILQITGMTDK